MDDDSPETVAAAFSLGLQHPPGYVLSALSLHLFSLFPIGNVGFRMNLASAGLGAFNAVLVALLTFGFLKRLFPGTVGKPALFPPWVCALCASLMTAFSRTFWEKSLGSKGFLYQGTSTLGLLMLACLWMRLSQTNQKNTNTNTYPWFLLASFLYGLGFCGHWETHILFFPILLAFGAKPDFFRKPPDLKNILLSAAFMGIGVSTILYLPLRAHLYPALNLGAADRFLLFKADFFRAYTSGHDIGLIPTFWEALNHSIPWTQFSQLLQRILDIQGRAILHHFENEIGLLTLLLSLLGFIRWVAAKERNILGALLFPQLLLILALCSASWIPPGRLAGWYTDNFLLPLNWGFALLAGVGLFSLGAGFERYFLPRFPWAWLGSIGALLILGLPPYLGNSTWLNLSKQVLRYDYAVNLMKSLPRNSVFFAEADEDYFTLYYLQLVEQRRLDITMIPDFTLFETWGVEQVERLHPELGLDLHPYDYPDHFTRIQAANSQIVGFNLNRFPLGYSFFNGAFHQQYLSLHPKSSAYQSGIIWLLASPLSQKGPFTPLTALRLRHVTDCPSNNHPTLAGIWNIYQAAAK